MIAIESASDIAIRFLKTIARNGIPQFTSRALAVFLLSCSPVRADVVADWNLIALSIVASSAQRPADASHALGTVHVAMFEAMNFVEGAYVPRFLVMLPAPLSVSSEATAAAAAHHVLVQLFPQRQAALDAALSHSLAAIPEGQKKSAGQMTGRTLGGSIYAVWTPDRASDESRTARSGSASDHLAWSAIVAKLIEFRRLRPIEAARLHSLVSLAFIDATAASRDAARDDPCGPCVTSAAVLAILESEIGSTGVQKMQMTGIAAPVRARGTTQVRRSPSDWSLGQFDGAVNTQGATWAGDERGRKIGTQVLTYYRPIE